MVLYGPYLGSNLRFDPKKRQKGCGNCKYTNTSGFDEPCNSCGHSYKNWAPHPMYEKCFKG